MKRRLLFFTIFFLIFCFTPSVAAKEYIILNTVKAFKESPSGSRITTVGENGYLPSLTKVVVLEKNYAKGNGCRNAWYKVQYHQTEGFICSSDQVVREEADVDYNGTFEQEMLEKGFDKSYLPYLKSLHEKYPNWSFTRVDTALDWNDAVRNENIGEMALVNGSDESLRKKDEFGKDIPSFNEKGWYIASESTVGYYMDPRNFLTEEYIFMFQNLHYNEKRENESTVRGVLEGTFLNNNEYVTSFMKAASVSGASPMYLASRVRQEKGVGGGVGTDGARFSFPVDQNCLTSFGYQNSSSWAAKNNCGTNETYSGIYNFYNIGAYGSYQSPVVRGLIWAMGGFDASYHTYNRPWNTKEKAIVGGASYIANGYINAYQHTLYFQRFNVFPTATNATYTHQYMTNIKAHASEAYTMYDSYKKNQLLESSYEFLIPTYQNMPNTGTEIIPDNKPEEKVEEVEVMDPDTGLIASGYHLNNNYLSHIGFKKDIDTLKNDLQAVYNGFYVTEFKNKYQNNKNGIIGTGNFITIQNGKSSKIYTAIVYGDNNGDGEVTILDLLRVQKYILASSNLTDAEMIASDTNKDGLVNIIDLLRVQKQILGHSTIEQ